jgi:hypothetical protein
MVFAFVAAALAGYGVLHLSWVAYLALLKTRPDTADGIREAGPVLCLVVFFWALWLMLRASMPSKRSVRKPKSSSVFGRGVCDPSNAMELQPSHRSSSGSLAMLAAMRRASS